LLDWRAGVLAQHTGRLQHRSLLHDLTQSSVAVRMLALVDVYYPKVNLVSEVLQVFPGRGIPIEALEGDRIEEARALQAQIRANLRAGKRCPCVGVGARAFSL